MAAQMRSWVLAASSIGGVSFPQSWQHLLYKMEYAVAHDR